MAARRAQRGRTPAIDRKGIAKAVRRVGRRGTLAMQTVAEDLGVDVTTLYRHVGGVAELRRIWATEAAPPVKAWPPHVGETWENWLVAIARHHREALRKNPDLIEFALTALDPNFESLEHATRILVEFGFEPRSASFAHGFLVNNVVGYVYQERREEEEARQGRPALARLFQALEADRDAGRLATLRSLDLGPKDFESETAFDRFLRYVIDGIGAQPGAPPGVARGTK